MVPLWVTSFCGESPSAAYRRNSINGICMRKGPCVFALSEMPVPPHVISLAMCQGPQMLPDMQNLFFFWRVLSSILYLFIFVHAFCHSAYSSLWVTHVHGQSSTQASISSLALFHAVWPGPSLCLLFLVLRRCAAHLLFMNTCKASSSEANGIGTLPCFSVNNAVSTKLQSFTGIDGL